MEWRKGGYTLTDDRARIDAGAVHGLLLSTYWAVGRSLEAVEKSVANSICFALFYLSPDSSAAHQVGFARAVTDEAVFSWICDVVIEEEHRSKGLGKWMMEIIVSHPVLAGSEMVLRTKDMDALYENFGFKKSDDDIIWMTTKEN